MPPSRSTLAALAAALTLLAAGAQDAGAVRIGTDPYTTEATGIHRTAVEPDSFAAGKTIVASFQIGRFADGGAANLGWARSTDAGGTWTQGALSGITVAAGGPSARVTDPAVAYDPKRKVWLIASTPLDDPPSIRGNSIAVNRSTDGGATWGPPVTVVTATGISDFDKNWIACDQTPTSPHFGNCYAQWDDFGAGGRILMSTSTDGGKTWGPAKGPADGGYGLGGQPVVQPGGKVIVPYETADETAIAAFRSTNGGASWTSPTIVDGIYHNTVAGEMRAGALPSAEIDRRGRVFVAWEDCRFRACGTNDIVYSTSSDGVDWSAAKRVPIDPVGSGIDHFVPGIGVDRATSGRGARVGVAYHFIDNLPCSPSTCDLRIGFINSLDGGRTWSRPAQLAGPMRPNWLAPTSQGYMSGDYISTSFAVGLPRPVFAAASAPSGDTLNEAIFAARPPMRKPRPPRTLSDLRIKPFRFRARRSGASIATGRGAVVSYRASARGPTRFRVSRRVTRHGDRCDPPADRCRVWVGVSGRFRREDARGANSFRFTGRLDGVALRSGLYRLRAQPRDESRPPAKSVYARFRIVSEEGGAR